MRPGIPLLLLAGLWLACAILMAVLRLTNITPDAPWQLLERSWWLAGLLLLSLAAVDALRPGAIKNIALHRHLPHSLALGITQPVSLMLNNPLRRSLSLELGEAASPALSLQGLPCKLILAPGTEGTVRYQLTPIQRGDTRLGPLVARVHSRWRLWQHQIRLGESTELKIFPSFAPIAYLADIGMEQRLRQLGIYQAQARGEGMEFKQLREFIEGDALRQVDWKASARRRKPISREYQDERDQDIFFLLDCGRRLRHRDGEDLSHFDHALNAMLLSAYIALRQGDAVGLHSFAGSERWLSPIKGSSAINVLLNKVYDLQSTSQNSDFIQVAENFSNRHRKRALIVLISNIRDEDCSDLLLATRMLSKRHVVVIASMRETQLDTRMQKPVSNFDEALSYAATHQHLSERQKILRQLISSGVAVVDAPPAQLPIQLANEYMRLKKSHRL